MGRFVNACDLSRYRFATCVYRLSSVYRKIPRDLTEASLSGAGLSIVAALCMVFLFGMVCSFYH